ncbi:hypothetical protein TNCV_1998171 [Trichonephila clavipes]|uniref:Uncharacterized protein n=1 Tax=Trichonephila clavipes TaxID=2585209 RepID=A0A8X6RMA6_TRICX|nr:hypothetical protein TNCV_1998171 [Trichonephila clavipes]
MSHDGRSLENLVEKISRIRRIVQLTIDFLCLRNDGRSLLRKRKVPTKFQVDEEPKPRLPDSIARPITNMPLSRMENTTFVKPSIIDFHDMGLRIVLTVRTPKEQRLFNAY